MVDGPPVLEPRPLVALEVVHIAGGHDEDLPGMLPDGLGHGVPQQLQRLIGLGAHRNRDHLERRTQRLQKWQLHFQRMLVLMRLGVLKQQVAFPHEQRGETRVDGHVSQRHLPLALRHDRQRRPPPGMVRTEYDEPVRQLQPRVHGAGNAPRIQQRRVRRYTGYGSGNLLRRGMEGQALFHFLAQQGGFSRVEPVPPGGAADHRTPPGPIVVHRTATVRERIPR